MGAHAEGGIVHSSRLELVRCLSSDLLQGLQERGVLLVDKLSYLGKSLLDGLQLSFLVNVLERSLCPDSLLRRSIEIANQMCHGFILHILTDLQNRRLVGFQVKRSQERVAIFDTVVEELDEHSRVVMEVGLQPLLCCESRVGVLVVSKR
jgi:hypothetical protein